MDTAAELRGIDTGSLPRRLSVPGLTGCQIRKQPFYDAVKRLFDLAFSMIGLLLLLAPMALTALLICLDSPGGPIYTQRRLGKNGKPFTICKFRTMSLDAEKNGACWPQENDPRCTRVGRVLRRLRIDELPQLVNIFLGQMSLVGPRPERPEFYELFDSYIGGFRTRMQVRPGLTGWALVRGGWSLLPEEKLRYDMEYIERRSLSMDLRCLALTVRLLLCGHGTEEKTAKKDLLLLCQYFAPAWQSSSTLPTDIARYLASRGLRVDALVGQAKEYSPDGRAPKRETLDGVGVRRLWYLQCSRRGRLGRMLNFASFTAAVLLHLPLLRRCRCVLVSSNPPVLPLAALLAKRFYGTRLVFLAYDVYPEVAYASKSLRRGGGIDRAMRRLNAALYRRADAVIALTEEMRRYLLCHREGLRPARCAVIPNWAWNRPRAASAEDYARFGLEAGDFVVGYFGNMGLCQDMDTLMEAASLLKAEPGVRFLLAGHGGKLPELAARIGRDGLNKVRLLDFLHGEDYERALAVSACCVLSLEPGLSGLCAPSRYYSFLSAARPVIAVTEPGSYLAREIRREEIGAAVENGDAAGLARELLRLRDDPALCGAMGRRAGELARTVYAPELSLAKYETLIREVLRQ